MNYNNDAPSLAIRFGSIDVRSTTNSTPQLPLVIAVPPNREGRTLTTVLGSCKNLGEAVKAASEWIDAEPKASQDSKRREIFEWICQKQRADLASAIAADKVWKNHASELVKIAIDKGSAAVVKAALDGGGLTASDRIHGIWSAAGYARFTSGNKELIRQLPADHHACLELLWRKKLGHFWDQKGVTHFGEDSLRVTHGTTKLFEDLAAEALDDCGVEFRAFPKSLVNYLKDTIEASYVSKSCKELAQRFAEGQPIIIHTGFEGHAFQIVFVGSTILICNKGSGSLLPIEAYRVDPKRVSEQVLGRIRAYSNFPEEETLYLIRSELPNLVSGQFDSHLHALYEERWLGPRLQTVGNCSWVSFATAMHALTIHWLSQREGKRSTRAIQGKAYHLWETWRQRVCLKGLERYLEIHHNSSDTLHMDRSLLERIFAMGRLWEERKRWRVPELKDRFYSVESRFRELWRRRDLLSDLKDPVHWPALKSRKAK